MARPAKAGRRSSLGVLTSLWDDLPEALRKHLFLRAAERSITVEELLRLKAWRESAPRAPEVPWFKDFGSFKLCGEGARPRTFLLRGQVARGTGL
ncbi:MAG: hypothetical protein R3F05_16050 [Planctomycetota bacterium]|nr:hypothetical protein [Planctomycetota bacterium]MCB9825998.1 hypothetical protein [Planctomycetota bacterium]MCB9901605.1 hypothetical protein [Planctomycetota bacterium]